MRIAVLSNTENSYPRIMADGLGRMLTALGVTVDLVPRGLWLVRRPQTAPERGLRRFRSSLSKLLRTAAMPGLLRRLAAADAVIVIGHMPTAFMDYYMEDELLRSHLPQTPFVLYDLVYLPTRGSWMEWLRTGNPKMGISPGRHFGMERYDWYLCVSSISEYPLPEGLNPYSEIGMNLEDGTLYPEQGSEFTALLDFARTDHLDVRDMQMRALRDCGIPFTVLKGRYSIQQIRAAYRRHACYFVAHRESFGVPICELQACGAYVFTPYAEWCPSHWTKSDLYRPGAGRLSSNFVVYDNDYSKLCGELDRIRKSYDAAKVVETFVTQQPGFYGGSRNALAEFVNRLKAGEITADSHRKYSHIGAMKARG